MASELRFLVDEIAIGRVEREERENVQEFVV